MSRFSKYFLIVIIAVSTVLGLMRFNSLQIGASYDDAHYIILAESLSSGQGYQLINFPRPQIERAFPPGWPILLTPLSFLFPGNYAVLKLFTLSLWLASLFLIYKLFSKRVESPYLEILVGLVALNPLLVGASVTVMSESAYLFFSLTVLTIFDSWHAKTEGIASRVSLSGSEGSLRSKVRDSSVATPALAGGARENAPSERHEIFETSTNYWLIILISIMALYAQLIRTVGISIAIALVLYFLLTRRFREAGITVGIFALGALLQAWLNLRNGGSVISASYESQVFNSSMIEKIGQMWSNAFGYFNEILASSLVPIFGEKTTSLAGSAIPLLANTIIILLIIFGLVLSLKKFSLMDIYFIIYVLAILAFWNPRVGSVKARFLIPIIPFLYFYLIQGIKWTINKLTKNNLICTARITVSLACIIVLLLLMRNLQDWRNPVMNQMTDLSIGTAWIAQNAPSDAIVMVNEPVPAYVHAQRKTVAFPGDNQDFEKYLNNQNIDYIVISPKLQSPRTTKLDKLIETQILPILESHPERFVVVYSNSEYNVTVYRYTGDANQREAN